jgi:hypothetical protein
MIGGLMLGAAALLAVGIWQMRMRTLNQRQARSEARLRAAQWIEQGRGREALDLLQQHFDPERAFDGQHDWPVLMVEAALVGEDFTELEILVVQYPWTLREVEEAALWWLRVQHKRGHWLTVLPLLEHWPEERRRYPERWRMLEEDVRQPPSGPDAVPHDSEI